MVQIRCLLNLYSKAQANILIPQVRSGPETKIKCFELGRARFSFEQSQRKTTARTGRAKTCFSGLSGFV